MGNEGSGEGWVSTGVERLLFPKIVREGSTDNGVWASSSGGVPDRRQGKCKGHAAAEGFMNLRNIDKEVSRRW